jgi:hypothetical protein
MNRSTPQPTFNRNAGQCAKTPMLAKSTVLTFLVR